MFANPFDQSSPVPPMRNVPPHRTRRTGNDIDLLLDRVTVPVIWPVIYKRKSEDKYYLLLDNIQPSR